MSQRAARGARKKRAANEADGAKGKRRRRGADPARKAAGQARESAFMAAIVTACAGGILGLPSAFGVAQYAFWGNPTFVFPGAGVLCFVGLGAGLALLGCGAVGFLRNNARKPPSATLLTAGAGIAGVVALIGLVLSGVVWTNAFSSLLLSGFDKISLTVALFALPAVAAFLNWRALGAAKQARAADV